MNIMEGEEENGWIVVRHKKRKHIGKEVKPEKVFTKGGNASYDREVNLNLQEEFITHPHTVANIKTISTFLQGLQRPRVEVHCLGIGSFSSLLKPQIQLLFLRHCLIEQLREMGKEYSLNVFDPVFSS
jgi:homoaconitase/3-isopropylmalate dehydratase large subunit